MTEQEKIDQYRETLSLKYTEIIEMRNELKQYLLKHKINCANVNDLPTLQDYLQDVDTGSTVINSFTKQSPNAAPFDIAAGNNAIIVIGNGGSKVWVYDNTTYSAAWYNAASTYSAHFINNRFIIGGTTTGAPVITHSSDNTTWRTQSLGSYNSSAGSFIIDDVIFYKDRYFFGVDNGDKHFVYECSETDESFSVIKIHELTYEADSRIEFCYNEKTDILYVADSYHVYKFKDSNDTFYDGGSAAPPSDKLNCTVKIIVVNGDTFFLSYLSTGELKYGVVRAAPVSGGGYTEGLSYTIPTILPGITSTSRIYKARSKTVYLPEKDSDVVYTTNDGYNWEMIQLPYTVSGMTTLQETPSKSTIFLISNCNSTGLSYLESSFKTSKAAVLRLIGVTSSYTECTFEIHTDAIKSYNTKNIHVNFIATPTYPSVNNPTFTYSITQNHSANKSTLTITTDADFFHKGYPVVVDLIVGG